MSILYGLIPAAGRGKRAYPYTKKTPKCMLEIDGVPNLLRTISIMRNDLGIKNIIIVVGYLGDRIKDYFGDGKAYHVNITYVDNNELEKGLAYSIFLARKYINDYFCVMLSDEYYLDTNHRELLSFPYKDAIATCGIMHVDDRELIKRNYGVEIDGDRIIHLAEKPKTVQNDMLGCGTFIFSPEIFPLLEQVFTKSNTEYVELITFLDQLCKENYLIYNFDLKGTYVNINDRDSINLVKYHYRSRTFENNIISLLIYSEGNEEDLAFAIRRYQQLTYISHIYVILPYENTIEDIVKNCGASIIRCPPDVELYGEKLKFAMENAPGDIIILSEADYTFPNRDVSKLLAYLREADMVVGTRTTRQLIEQGSEMRGIVRAANVLLAKTLEILWWRYDATFSDVGCTFRAIWKSSFDNIKDKLVSKGPEFSAEMMIEILNAGDRVIQIPVNYFNRSQAIYRKYQNMNTFFRGVLFLCKKSIQRFLAK